MASHLSESRLPHLKDEEQPLQEPHWTYVLAEAAERAETEWLIYLDPMMHPSPGAELFLPHRLQGWGTGEVERLVHAPGWAFRGIGELEWEWVRRVFSVRLEVDRESMVPGPERVIPADLQPGRILRHLRLGPSATMIRRSLMLEAFSEWLRAFADLPFEVFLTLRLRRDVPPDPAAVPPPTQPPPPDRGGDPIPVMIFSPAGMGVCRPQDWGWNT